MTTTPLYIAIGSDHAGFELKQQILSFFSSAGITYKDYGTYSNGSADYPDYVHPLAKALGEGEFTLGIVVCGSGNGVNITANKYAHIRSALCWVPEIASLARKHNNANVLALPARFIDLETAIEIVKVFLYTEFEGGRHQTRIDKITCS
jgi:ribose 5-phosphate isomerase B